MNAVSSIRSCNSPSHGGGCQGCEQFKQPLHGPGKLYVYFPLRHSVDKFTGALRNAGKVCNQSGNIITVEWPETALNGLVALADDNLTSVERDAGRALFQPNGQDLKEADFFTASSVDRFIGELQVDWLQNLLREERLFSVYQPIVRAENAEIYAYESLMRGVETAHDFQTMPEKTIPPFQLLQSGRRAGLLFHLDLAARRAAIRGASIYGVKQKLFINFTPTAIYDPRFCLATTIALVKECGLNPSQVVFEVIESEQVQESSHLTSILNMYRENGFGVALDDIGSAYSSLNMLLQLRPDYMKIDRDMISGVHQDSYKATVVAKLLETARNLNVISVAEGVEEEEEWRWLQRHGADLIQGFYFGRPDLLPAQELVERT